MLDYSAEGGAETMVNRGGRRWGVYSMRAAVLLLLLAMLFGVALANGMLFPQSSKEGFLEKNGTVVDAGHAGQGYIRIKHRQSKKRLKVRISQGEESYTYDLNQNGEFEVFPLQLGSGSYKVRVFEQVKGTQYSGVSNISFKADLEDENLPYLYPNQYVSYDADSAAVAQSLELCASLESDRQKVDAIEKYLTGKFMYDYLKVYTIKQTTTYLPDVDATLAEKKGLCFDFAALMCCMLRVQGIPTQLVIGYADNAYHAWNQVLVDGEWRLIDTTSRISGTKVKRYTPERRY